MILLLLTLACAGDVDLLLSDLDSVNPAVRQAAVIDARSLNDERVIRALEQLHLGGGTSSADGEAWPPTS